MLVVRIVSLMHLSTVPDQLVCVQYAVESSFRSAAIFCSCPMNYNNAIYKGGVVAPA